MSTVDKSFADKLVKANGRPEPSRVLGSAMIGPAFMPRETSAALLAQSRAFTEPRRAARKVDELLAEFSRIGFGDYAARELARIQIELDNTLGGEHA